MPRHWGPGPVFVYESITAARRWQGYALRSLFVLALLTCLWAIWSSLDLRPNLNGYTLRQLASVGESFYYGLASIQLGLILLAAPAATAGAICLDRARGTLTHMIVTDLTDAEIVLGKLGARLVPVMALIVIAVPVTSIATLLGGVEPWALVMLLVVSLVVAVFGCSLSLAVSVHARKMYEVLMVVYTVWAVWLLAAMIAGILARGFLGLPHWFLMANPLILAFSPYAMPGASSGVDLAVFATVILGLSAVINLVAIRRLRRDDEVQVARSEKWRERLGYIRAHVFSWWPNPTLDGNPVLWREWHKSRPSRAARFVWGLYLILAVLGTAWGVYSSLNVPVTPGPNTTMIVNAFQVSFGLLFLSILAPTALSEERARESIDVLMSTPISTASIVLGKWWGTFRLVPALVVLPALGALMMAAAAPEDPAAMFARMRPMTPLVTDYDRVAAALLPAVSIIAHGALITSLGLAFSTWIARPGRALALNVSIFAVMTIGTIVVVEAVLLPYLRRNPAVTWPDYQWLEQGLIALSAFGGQVVPLDTIIQMYHLRRTDVWWLVLVVDGFLFALAGVLVLLTIATFDRCLGRVPERRRDWFMTDAPRLHDPALDGEVVGSG
jgi:ABC-type transport system involved in multi-copper enzyme maturation permease subunit